LRTASLPTSPSSHLAPTPATSATLQSACVRSLPTWACWPLMWKSSLAWHLLASLPLPST
jgi:hypothetical protein